MADHGDLDALRRGLYRADATEADLARYAAALAAEQPPEQPEQPAAPRAGLRVLPVVAGAAVLLLVVGVGAGLAATAHPPGRGRRRAPSSRRARSNGCAGWRAQGCRRTAGAARDS